MIEDAYITRADLECLIATAEMRPGRSAEALFAADSVMWRVNRESALFLGAGRAALLQLAHPWVATALAQHSSLLERPVERFHNTFRVVFSMVFGTARQAVRAARSLHQMHEGISGDLSESIAGYQEGSRYEALQVHALRWVFATLVESAVIAYECVLPLSVEDRETYYKESRILAGLFGLPENALPSDWSAFQAYVTSMLASQALAVGEEARRIGQKILSGSGSWVPVPRWYRALTAEWLPASLCEDFGIVRGPGQRVAADRARRLLMRIYPALRPALRYVGPYQEAQRRLEGRPPGVVARYANLFWIGQPRMPFADKAR